MLLRWLTGSLRKRDMVDARSWQLSASRKTGNWRSSEAAESATSRRDEILPLARIGATSLLCCHLPSRLPVILGMIVPAPGVVVEEKRVRGKRFPPLHTNGSWPATASAEEPREGGFAMASEKRDSHCFCGAV